MKKKKRDAQKTKQKLLDTAEIVFVKKGYDGARVDEIANEAGVNKRMIYVFFGSKELLYVEVLRNSFTRLFHADRPEPNNEADPIEQVENVVRWYFWFLSENPNFVRLFGWETLHDGSRAGKVLFDLMGEGLGPLQTIVKRGKKMGCFHNDLAVHKVITIINEMCLGFFSRMSLFEVLWQRDLEDRREQSLMLDHILMVLRDGLCTESRQVSDA
ncbi:MAG: TetR/AcrR family transcriptional regulator [Deltaproteobacteria bacterium]|nr:TetR/AcrR family transcriptional regulator [Deltaproteobacteria bacterium]